MIHRKDKGSDRIRESLAEVECPACACPNKPEAVRCMYCRGILPTATMRFDERYLAKFREFFRKAPAVPKKRNLVLELALSGALSIAFLSAGGLFLVKALKHGGSMFWMVAAILTLYGGAALRNGYRILFNKKTAQNP